MVVVSLNFNTINQSPGNNIWPRYKTRHPYYLTSECRGYAISCFTENCIPLVHNFELPAESTSQCAELLIVTPSQWLNVDAWSPTCIYRIENSLLRVTALLFGMLSLYSNSKEVRRLVQSFAGRIYYNFHHFTSWLLSVTQSFRFEKKINENPLFIRHKFNFPYWQMQKAINILTKTWQNQLNYCVLCEADTDQPGHFPSLISLRCPCKEAVENQQIYWVPCEADTDQPGHSPSLISSREETVDLKIPIQHMKQKHCLDWPDSQADLNLRRALWDISSVYLKLPTERR